MSWNEDDLIRKGFVKNPDGTWCKPERQPLAKPKEVSPAPKDLSHCLFIPGHVPSSKKKLPAQGQERQSAAKRERQDENHIFKVCCRG